MDKETKQLIKRIRKRMSADGHDSSGLSDEEIMKAIGNTYEVALKAGVSFEELLHILDCRFSCRR